MIPMPAQGNIIILIGRFQNIAKFVEVGGLETIKDIEKDMLDFQFLTHKEHKLQKEELRRALQKQQFDGNSFVMLYLFWESSENR